MIDFTAQFYAILQHPEVVRSVQQLRAELRMDEGASTYFGVNYTDQAITSVKLYFVFQQQFPPESLLEKRADPLMRKLIAAHWKPASAAEYVHRGLTFGLKCYPAADGEIRISDYVYFRTDEYAWGEPEQLTLTPSDRALPCGLCAEQGSQEWHYKRYYYLYDPATKAQVLEEFGLSDKIPRSLLDFVEYTESATERKINLNIIESHAVLNLLRQEDNPHILALSGHLYAQHQLYVCAPGYRLHSPVRALYYMPGAAFGQVGYKPDTLALFF